MDHQPERFQPLADDRAARLDIRGTIRRRVHLCRVGHRNDDEAVGRHCLRHHPVASGKSARQQGDEGQQQAAAKGGLLGHEAIHAPIGPGVQGCED